MAEYGSTKDQEAQASAAAGGGLAAHTGHAAHGRSPRVDREAQVWGRHLETRTGIPAGVCAALSYLFGWLSALIVYVIERENAYVRFHAMQSFLFSIVLSLFAILGRLIRPWFGKAAPAVDVVVGLFIAAVTIFLMVKAYKGAPSDERYCIPFIGEFSERFTA